MTPQEAHKILEMFLHKQCDLERTKFAYSENEVWEAVSMADDSLEKQIPKKPIIHGVRDRDINTISYTCPICNKHIDKDNYCKHCGQALDWSEE